MSESKPLRKKHAKIIQHGKIDITFLSFVLILLTIGLVMLFSSSYAYSYEYYGTSYRFIIRQSAFAAGGVVVMFAFSIIDYHIWRRFCWLIYGVTVALLIFLLIYHPMLSGTSVKRWFVIGPINFQPSELAKFSIVLLFSNLIAANQSQMKTFKFTAILLGILGFTCVLVLAEPHISAALLIGIIGIILMIIGGLQKRYMTAGIILVAGGGTLAYITGIIGYANDKIKYWLDPWSDPRGGGFQIIQSLLAIGSGGILGRGIGQSRQKYLWVPEPHNDFIFAIVCEELGLIGAVAIVILFALLVWRGFNIGMRAADKFGSFLSIGLTFQVGLQAMLNIWVVTNTVPNTGISLPFFSYGGTSLLLLLAEMGIVLSVSRGANKNR